MSTGLFMGFLGWLSVLFMWKSMPRLFKMWSLRHPVITDILVGIVTFYTMSMFSHSIASMVATVVSGLLMNFTLMGLATPGGRAMFHLEEKRLSRK